MSRRTKAIVVLIEDSASGTQLFQELSREGLRGITLCKPERDKTMRLHTQTGLIENGAIFLPREAPWRAEYLHELVTFPSSKYDDQVDSTSQALAWFSQRQVEPSALVAWRRQLVRKLLEDGLPVAEMAKKMRKNPEQVQIWIDEENQRSGKPAQVPAPGNRWNPWQGTWEPK